MMGQRKFNMKQHHQLCLDDLVAPGHLYRKIDQVIDFSFIYDLAKSYYSHTGQPSLDPVVFFKIELVSFLEGIHEDRALERRVKDSLGFAGFLVTILMQSCRFIPRFQGLEKIVSLPNFTRLSLKKYSPFVFGINGSKALISRLIQPC